MQISRTHSLPPQVYILLTFLVAVVSFYLFYSRNISLDLFYFVPILVLGFLYGLVNLGGERIPAGHFQKNTLIKPATLFKKALARYLVWLLAIGSAKWLYHSIAYYNANDFAKALPVFEQLYTLYLILGMPYFIITLKYKASRIEDFYDPAVRIIHLGKQALLALTLPPGNSRFHKAIKKQYNRKVLLTLIMRSYFIPVMVVQVYYNLSNAISIADNPYNSDQVLAFIYFVAAIFWLMDTLNASVAYLIETRWLENRTRSIDMTFSGWLVCFSCYAPLNIATGTLFPWAPGVESSNPVDLVAGDITTLYIIKGVELAVLMLHIMTNLSLGPSIANISLRKIQTRGPYGIIRHPGTTLKLTFFTLQSVVYKQFWQLRYIYGLLMWGTIYVLRALTEERHLSHYPEYREYKKKVKHRFFPGLF